MGGPGRALGAVCAPTGGQSPSPHRWAVPVPGGVPELRGCGAEGCGVGVALTALPGPHSVFPVGQVEMGEYGIAPGQRVAVIWDSSSPVEALKGLVDAVQASVGADSRVSVENINQLCQCKNDRSFSLCALKGECASAS